MRRREGIAICGAELPDSLEDLLTEGEGEDELKEPGEGTNKTKKETKKKAEKQK